MNNNSLHLFKLLLKDNLNKIIIWLASIIGITLLTAYIYPTLYETDESIFAFANIMANPAMKAMLGGAYPIEAYTHAIIFSQEILLLSTVAIAIMNIYFSIKFTKVSEENGITEILHSKPVNRKSFLTSSLLLIILLNLIIFFTVSLGLIILNIDGSTFISSIIYGSILFLIGLLFSGIGFVSSKLYNNSSTAYTFSYLLLFVFYLIRAIGDISNEILSNLSPLGWINKIQVFHENNAIYLLFLLILTISLFLFSLYLYKIIDYGSSVFSTNKGKVRANKSLQTPFGLIFKLEKTQILVWTITLLFLTYSFGAILYQFDVFLELDIIKAILGENTADFTITLIMYIVNIISIFALLPSLLIILKLGKEEKNKFLDNVYSRATSRTKYFINHIVFSIIFSIIIQVIIFLGLYISGRDYINTVLSFSKYLEITLALLPAIWFILSLASLLLSLGLKYLNLIWAYFSFVFLNLYLGDVLEFPGFIKAISSFHHINNYDSNLFSSIILILLSAILFITSINIYNKRDLY